MPITDAQFPNFILSLLEKNEYAKNIIVWIGNDKFKIINRNLLAQWWSFHSRKLNNSKLTKTSNTDYDKVRRNFKSCCGLGVFHEVETDIYFFKNKQEIMKNKAPEKYEFPFEVYELDLTSNEPKPQEILTFHDDLVYQELKSIHEKLDLIITQLFVESAS